MSDATAQSSFQELEACLRLEKRLNEDVELAIADMRKALSTEEGNALSRFENLFAPADDDDDDEVKITARMMHDTLSAEDLDVLDAWTVKAASTARTLIQGAKHWSTGQSDTVKEMFEDFLKSELTEIEETVDVMKDALKTVRDGRPGWTFDADKVDLSTAILFGDEA
jgi:hypothetical protein